MMNLLIILLLRLAKSHNSQIAFLLLILKFRMETANLSISW